MIEICLEGMSFNSSQDRRVHCDGFIKGLYINLHRYAKCLQFYLPIHLFDRPLCSLFNFTNYVLDAASPEIFAATLLHKVRLTL